LLFLLVTRRSSTSRTTGREVAVRPFLVQEIHLQHRVGELTDLTSRM
jgi:hypothetical protein